MRRAGVLAVVVWGLAAGAAQAASEKASPSADVPKGQRPLLIVMNKVVEGLVPRILAGPSEVPHRASIRDGLLGLGPYQPPGGSDSGIKSPPRVLFSRAGLGNSLSVDPITGRNALTNTP